MARLPLRIRNYSKEDLETLCEIDRTCFPEYIAFTRADFENYLNYPESITRLGERLGRILGFVMAYVDRQICARVITLDVIPEARHQQIGTTLMHALHEELQRRDIRAALLEVSTCNVPAQRLYEKLNYRYVETLAGYYNGREDAYRMIRLIE